MVRAKPIGFFVILFVAVFLATGAAPLTAQTRLSVVKQSEEVFAVSLANLEPIAALQFTINTSSNLLLHAPQKSGRIAGSEWALSYKQKNDSTINVVIFSAGTWNLDPGSGSLLMFSVTRTPGTERNRISLSRVVVSSPGAQPVETMVDNFEWTSPSTDNTISLQQNFPNPFNPTTTIPYTLRDDAHVNLSIYDITGRVIKTIVDRSQSAGVYAGNWDSTDEAGHVVPSGVYFVRLQAGANVEARKMILTR